MGKAKPVTDRLHDAMHRIPLVPPHEEAAERNANHGAKARHAHWNHGVNEAGAARADRWNSNAAAGERHARPARVLVGWQEWIGRRFEQGKR